MNSARPTKKATPTSKNEGDQPIVEATAKLLTNDKFGAAKSVICQRFLRGSLSPADDGGLFTCRNQANNLMETKCADSSLHRT
jgi:hypothetical protein